MKAKIYSNETGKEIRFNGKLVITANEGEAEKAFLKRANIELEKIIDEKVDIIEADVAIFEKMGNTQITEVYKNANGILEQILKPILEGRGLETAKIVKAAKGKIEKVDLAEAKKSKIYIDSIKLIGSIITFTPGKSEEELCGTIKGVAFNKTNTQLYFNVKIGDSLKCCSVKNQTIQVCEY